MIKKLTCWLVILALALTGAPSFAEGRGGHHGRDQWHHDRGGYHRDGWGPWGWFGAGVASALVAGAVVDSVEQRDVIIIDDQEYLYDGEYYYKRHGAKYIVVDDPHPRVIRIIR